MSEAIVLGAGMVGVASALALQARGHQVVLVDRREPGRETSYGNAGIIQAEAMEPYAMPLGLGDLFAIAARRTNNVHWHLAALPGMARPLLAYLAHSFPARHRAASVIYSQLIRRATSDHAPLIEASGAGDLVSRDGFRQAYRSARRMDEAVKEAEHLRREYGVGVRVLTSDMLSAEEPALRKRLEGALHWTEAWSSSDPGGLVAAYADLFARRGGTLATGDAMSLARHGAAWRVMGDAGPIEAENVVVALGPWSPQLLARFGYPVPMLRKRGYHRHYRQTTPLRQPLMDTETGAVCSPMRIGLRIATGAELAAFDAAPTPRQLAFAERRVAELFDLGEPVEAEPWLGNRPCMPDMLPVVGRAPRDAGLWFHFGHGHQGFTLGPTTANLLAAQVDGERGEPLAESLAYRF
ncbi:NAD(P)/FAD-dependent oxidoreductase [Consotaella salsifontis]|uniref:D-amino-acid dehydrogenase n=1 Tax=Consotaella salsifontis TaxID=1365950 RepID=A0A1T4SVS1_9HYPH|nr:FAD-dependent oxidoreductase [Consotaella salsifontis]SKA31981.1 D-amino-acid dehydrogenase [Consotaella salsifontis]